MSDFGSSEFSWLFSESDQSRIAQLIADGYVTVNPFDADAMFTRISHLPHDSRIQWSNIPNISIQTRNDPDGIGVECKLDLLKSLGRFYGLESSMGILFEDMFADCVLQMDFSVFARLEAEFFTGPGHKYFLSTNDDWLVNFTMEGSLHFSNRI